MQAAREMRELTFSFRERLVLTPIEIIDGMKSCLFAGLPLSLLAGFSTGVFSTARFLIALLLYLVAVLSGAVLTPLLLPLLPGRMFSVKGAAAGAVCSLACISILDGVTTVGRLDGAAALLVMTVVSAFYAMNFTGSTPYTSPSGVRREMQRSLPVMAGAVFAGLIVIVTGMFLS